MSLLLNRGSDLDVLFRHVYSSATAVNISGKKIHEIQELGGQKSKLEWVEVACYPLLFIQRDHAELFRQYVSKWVVKPMQIGNTGNVHDSTDFSISSEMFRVILQDLKQHLETNQDNSFEFVFYTFGQQVPTELMHFVDEFIKADFEVIADIATTFTQYPRRSEQTPHVPKHVLLFKSDNYKYNKPEFHPCFSYSQGLRAGDKKAFGGMKWKTLKRDFSQPDQPFHGK